MFRGVEAFLSEPTLDQLKPKAPGELQVGTRSGVRVLICSRRTLAPVFEQIVVQLFNVQGVATLFRSATDHHPWGIEPGVQLFLFALGASAAAHVIGACAMFQTEVGLEALQHIVAKIFFHGGYFTAFRLWVRAAIRLFCAAIAGT
ncbi:hypothetical protein D3C85_1410130 [compost metagenome]